MTTAMQDQTSATTATTGTVDRFLRAIVDGQGATMGSLYAPDATLDATMPNWRYHRRGRDGIAEHAASWFEAAGAFEELERRPVPGGEVVTYLMAWEQDGAPLAVHHCHVLAVDPASGLITDEQVWCGGRWDAATLAEIQAADDGR